MHYEIHSTEQDVVRDLNSITPPASVDMSDVFFEGAILTGDQIQQEIEEGNIEIVGFDPNRLNENSYNVTISPTILTYNLLATEDFVMDIKNPPDLVSATISEQYGYILHPEKLYLGSTNEIIHSDVYVPILTGRSSFGRLGLNIHQTGNFGDLGYHGTWTLQIRSAFPTKIYPNIAIAQIYFIRPYGKITKLYSGKYQNSDQPTPSRIYSEIERIRKSNINYTSEESR